MIVNIYTVRSDPCVMCGPVCFTYTWIHLILTGIHEVGSYFILNVSNQKHRDVN